MRYLFKLAARAAVSVATTYDQLLAVRSLPYGERALAILRRHRVLRERRVPPDLAIGTWRRIFPCAVECDVSRRESLRNNDLKYFRDLHTLNMGWCRGVSDVSALGALHTLNMYACDGVTNVSALGSLHTLNMWRCWRVTDVSALGGLHTLVVAECYKVTDVSALGGLHTLGMYGCTGITDVSALGGVIKLYR